METSNEKKKVNIHKIISTWKEGKKLDEVEAKDRFKTPEYQKILKELREKNAKRGIIIPE